MKETERTGIIIGSKFWESLQITDAKMDKGKYIILGNIVSIHTFVYLFHPFPAYNTVIIDKGGSLYILIIKIIPVNSGIFIMLLYFP